MAPQFASVEICRWLAAINCEHVRTPLYHPRSNELAECFMHTLKDHIWATKQGDLQSTVDRFLLQYRNIRYTMTSQAPAFLMQNHLLHSSVVSLSGQTVWARKYFDKNELWQKGQVIAHEGKNIVDVKLEMEQVQKCHTEQTKLFVELPASAECNQYSSGTSGAPMTNEDDEAQNSVTVSRPRRNTKVPDRLTYH